MPSYIWDNANSRYRNLQGGTYDSGGAEALAYDWSEANQPWAYTSTSQFTEGWPGGVTIVDIQTGGADFWTNLSNTVSAAGARVVVRLGEGVYNLDKFRMIGGSGNPLYSFGFWFPNLQGLLGQGPDKTFVQLGANATTVDTNGTTNRTTDAHTAMASMTAASFQPLNRGMARFDGTSGSPVLLAGLTFRAADQLPLTATAGDVNIFTPQPSPHHGVVLYQYAHARVQYVRFEAAARSCTSAPPFECGSISSQYGNVRFYHCEFDGRRSADLDAARPRRCLPIMGNNETYHLMEDCYIHHSNLGRYAVNDENQNTSGQYILTRVKAEQMTNTQNRDPALNSLGGYENSTPFGWESCNGTITVTDCIISQDNNQSSGQTPMHLQLTTVGGRNPQGGRMYVHGGTFRNTGWPQLENFVCYRIGTSSYWWADGVENTLFVYHKDGQRLLPYVISGGWPPNVATLTASGITPTTHYLVRMAG